MSGYDLICFDTGMEIKLGKAPRYSGISEGDLVSVSGVLCKVEAVMTVYSEDSEGYKMALAAAQCIPEDIITLSEYYKRKELEVEE